MQQYPITLACLAVACGRLEFGEISIDAAVDTPTGHDEDGDELPDSVDPCPHVAGDAADGDLDGVGDACDPNPGIGTDQLIRFSTLQPGDHPFDDIGALLQEPDALRMVGNGVLDITRTVRSMRVDLGFEILALEANPQKQIGCGIIYPGTPYYFVELNDFPGSTHVAVVTYAQTQGYTIIAQTPHGGVHLGPGIFQVDVTAGTAAQFRVHAGWVGEMYETQAVTPGYDQGTAIHLVFNGLDIRIRYAVLIESP